MRGLPLFIVGFVFAGLASYWGVGALRRWAVRRSLLDIPNERSSHSNPTPRGGGLGIVVITLVGLVVARLFDASVSLSAFLAYLSGAALVAGVSWLDDLRSLPNRIRFGAHSLAAGLVLLGIGHWRAVDLPVIGAIDLGWLGVPITFLWLTGLTNAYNFMDGIDGIAGGQAVVAGLGWAVLGWLSDQALVSITGLLLAASSVGFLGHNWPSARIFMGDVGSAFLGYSFAVLPVIACQNNSRLALVGVLLVWPFVFDTAFTFLRRVRHRENVFAAHRSHLYQRLTIAGLSHLPVTSLYIGLDLLGMTLAFVWFRDVGSSDACTVTPLLLACLALWVLVVRWEGAQARRSQSR